MLDNLLTDPQGYEVLWDYCLEYDIPMPSHTVAIIGEYYQGAVSYSGIGYSYSYSNYNKPLFAVSGAGRFQIARSAKIEHLRARSASGRYSEVRGYVHHRHP